MMGVIVIFISIVYSKDVLTYVQSQGNNALTDLFLLAIIQSMGSSLLTILIIHLSELKEQYKIRYRTITIELFILYISMHIAVMISAIMYPSMMEAVIQTLIVYGGVLMAEGTSRAMRVSIED